MDKLKTYYMVENWKLDKAIAQRDEARRWARKLKLELDVAQSDAKNAISWMKEHRDKWRAIEADKAELLAMVREAKLELKKQLGYCPWYFGNNRYAPNCPWLKWKEK
ncbi:MAG: hypothetical protein DRJ03_01395 [Chloroflexi bacterium]|nr:MAG: hypothetical protein DRJ03_01395 [Chloroflexota bacterium]